MSLHTLALEQKPVDVALSMSGTRLAVLSDKDLAVYALDMSKRPVAKPALLWRSDALQGHSPRHVVFTGDEQIFVLTDSWDEDESCLWRSEGQELLPQGPIMEADHASFLSSSVDYQDVYVQLQNGALHHIDTDESSADLPPQTSLVHKFPAFSAEAKTVVADGQVGATFFSISTAHIF
jgi:elongator complex protein 1